MSDLARRLREAREARGLTLAQAELATKIRTRFLTAMEAGDYARLPDGLSARGFIKNYARYLCLDYTQAIADFEVEYGVIAVNAAEHIPGPPTRERARSRYTEVIRLPEPHFTGELPPVELGELDAMADADAEDPAPPRTGANGRPLVVVDARRDFSQADSSFKLQAPRTRTLGTLVDGISTFVPGDGLRDVPAPAKARPGGSSLARAGGILRPQIVISAQARRVILAFGAAVAGIVLLVLAARSVVPLLSRASATPTAIAAVTSAPVAAVPVTPSPVAPAGALAAPTQTVLPAAPITGNPLQVVLDSRERAWVRVRVDGRVAFEGIPALGPGTPWRAQTSVAVETANAGAFEAILNGTRQGVLGERNAAAKLTYAADGKITRE